MVKADLSPLTCAIKDSTIYSRCIIFTSLRRDSRWNFKNCYEHFNFELLSNVERELHFSSQESWPACASDGRRHWCGGWPCPRLWTASARVAQLDWNDQQRPRWYRTDGQGIGGLFLLCRFLISLTLTDFPPVSATQHRTRNLVEGYEYIQGLATQLPEMFKETAEQHRKTLQGAIHSLGPEEQAIIAENDEVHPLVHSIYCMRGWP